VIIKKINSMKSVVLSVILAVCVIGAFAEVEVLNQANFNEKTKEGFWLIKFFAPWCGHCKRLAPTWIELSEKANGKFHVAEVDCTVEKDLASRFGIRGFPTIKFIANGGDAEDVRVPRTVEAYMDYMEKAIGGDKPATEKPAEEKPAEKKEEEKPKAGVLSLTAANFDAELEKKPLAVKFFAPWCGHCKRLAPTWVEFAEANPDSPFVVAEVDCTAQKELCNKYEVHGYPTIKYLVKGETPVEFHGARTKEALQKWADGLAKKQHSEL